MTEFAKSGPAGAREHRSVPDRMPDVARSDGGASYIRATEIGKPEKEIEVVPLFDPVPKEEPTPEEAPVEPERVPVPA